MVRAFVLCALAAAAIAADYAAVSAAMRAMLTLPFLLAGPGLAWLSRPGDLKIAAFAATVISLSLAMETAIGSLLLVCGLWSPQAGLGMLLFATVAGLLSTGSGDAQTGQHSRRRESGTSGEQGAQALTTK
jgi:hypothetical protein